MAADIYTVASHKGRGGWTWYTGSAGWMYQLILESFIGLKKQGTALYFTPCMPEDWGSVKMQYRYMDTLYLIEIVQTNQKETTQIFLDDELQPDKKIPLVNDAGEHIVKIMC